MPMERAINQIGWDMNAHLPPGHEGAAIIVGPAGEVACYSDMDLVKLAIVLGKLTEDLVREAKQPIFEGVKNGTEQKES